MPSRRLAGRPDARGGASRAPPRLRDRFIALAEARRAAVDASASTSCAVLFVLQGERRVPSSRIAVLKSTERSRRPGQPMIVMESPNANRSV